MFSYKIFNKPKQFKLSKDIIGAIFEFVNKKYICNGKINIIFESDKIIKELNKEYRNIDSTTDVLSFPYFEDFSGVKKNDIAGEIILSESRIINQSLEYNNSLEEEFYKLLIHSIYHILGFDHIDDEDYIIMKKLEDEAIFFLKEKYKIEIN